MTFNAGFVRQKGRDAGRKGAPRTACPYSPRGEDGRRNMWHDAWMEGWQQGHQHFSREYPYTEESKHWRRLGQMEGVVGPIHREQSRTHPVDAYLDYYDSLTLGEKP